MRSPTASRTSSTKTACSARSTGSGDSPVLEEPELTCAKKTTRTPKTPGFRGLCAIGTPERESRSCAKTKGGERDSNPRPPGPQPGALPTELPPPRPAQDSVERWGILGAHGPVAQWTERQASNLRAEVQFLPGPPGPPSDSPSPPSPPNHRDPPALVIRRIARSWRGAGRVQPFGWGT